MPFQLTKQLVIEKAREAYLAKRLTAQHPDPAHRVCRYRSDGYCCAVGAAIPDTETAILLHSNGSSVSRLWATGKISCNSQAEMEEVLEIQKAHDNWCRESHVPGSSGAEEKFKKLIGL